MIQNLLQIVKISQDWYHFMILIVVSDFCLYKLFSYKIIVSYLIKSDVSDVLKIVEQFSKRHATNRMGDIFYIFFILLIFVNFEM